MSRILTSAFRQDLQRLRAAVTQSVAERALLAGAQPIREAAATLAPRSAGRGLHIADHIVVAAEQAGETGAKVAIGPANLPGLFYGPKLEFGTAHTPAQPFMRPAFDQHRKTTLRIVGREFWSALRRSVRGG